MQSVYHIHNTYFNKLLQLGNYCSESLVVMTMYNLMTYMVLLKGNIALGDQLTHVCSWHVNQATLINSLLYA